MTARPGGTRRRDPMRNEIHDKACSSCGSTISRRRYSRSGLCLGCQEERRKIARKKGDQEAGKYPRRIYG